MLSTWCSKTKLNAIFEIDPLAMLAELTEDVPVGCISLMNGKEEASLEEQFGKQWTHPGPVPSIVSMYSIKTTSLVRAGFKKRQKLVKDRMKAAEIPIKEAPPFPCSLPPSPIPLHQPETQHA